MIPPKEACGRGRQAYIETIPEGLEEDICRCKPAKWPDVYAITKKLPNSGDVGITVHTTCNRPANLWTYIEICENCEEYYIVTKYPDKNLLCSSCDF